MAKVVFLGDPNVGKTSILIRYATKQFNQERIPTIGGACIDILIHGLRISFWDTAGQERYHSLAPMYYHNAHAAIIVFSMDEPASFHRVRLWLDELSLKGKRDCRLYVFGNKIDKEHLIDEAEVIETVKQYGAEYFACSAKTGEGIDESIERIGLELADTEPSSTITMQSLGDAWDSSTVNTGNHTHSRIKSSFSGCTGGSCPR